MNNIDTGVTNSTREFIVYDPVKGVREQEEHVDTDGLRCQNLMGYDVWDATVFFKPFQIKEKLYDFTMKTEGGVRFLSRKEVDEGIKRGDIDPVEANKTLRYCVPYSKNSFTVTRLEDGEVLLENVQEIDVNVLFRGLFE